MTEDCVQVDTRDVGEAGEPGYPACSTPAGRQNKNDDGPESQANSDSLYRNA